MEENLIDLKVTPKELSIIFACLTGSYSCPPEHSDLVNKFYALCKEHRAFTNVYCE